MEPQQSSHGGTRRGASQASFLRVGVDWFVPVQLHAGNEDACRRTHLVVAFLCTLALCVRSLRGGSLSGGGTCRRRCRRGGHRARALYSALAAPNGKLAAGGQRGQRRPFPSPHHDGVIHGRHRRPVASVVRRHTHCGRRHGRAAVRPGLDGDHPAGPDGLRGRRLRWGRIPQRLDGRPAPVDRIGGVDGRGGGGLDLDPSVRAVSASDATEYSRQRQRLLAQKDEVSREQAKLQSIFDAVQVGMLLVTKRHESIASTERSLSWSARRRGSCTAASRATGFAVFTRARRRQVAAAPPPAETVRLQLGRTSPQGGTASP